MEDNKNVIEQLPFFANMMDNLSLIYTNLPYASRLDSLLNVFQLLKKNYDREHAYTKVYIDTLTDNIQELQSEVEKLKQARDAKRLEVIDERLNQASAPPESYPEVLQEHDDEDARLQTAISNVLGSNRDILDLLTIRKNKRKRGDAEDDMDDTTDTTDVNPSAMTPTSSNKQVTVPVTPVKKKSKKD